MGYFTFGFATGLQLAVSDASFNSVYDAAKKALDDGMYVSFCAPDGDGGKYLQIDVTVFVPGVTGAESKELAQDRTVMWMRPHPSCGEADIDPLLVDQLLEVMKETDGCIVLDGQDHPITDADAAKACLVNAVRFNAYSDVIWPNPRH